MNRKGLNFVLQEGEGQYIEFKESFNNLEKEIVAFANASGGKVFLGVSDKNKVVGIKITNKLKSQIQDIARNCDPNIFIEIEEFENILVVNVLEGKDKPYSCSSGFYLRAGPNSQKMKRDEIIEFSKKEGKIKFDQMANEEFDLGNDFDNYKFKLYLEKAKITDNINKFDVLKNLNLIENNKLRNAGVLFFSSRITNFFMNAVISCVLYQGNTKTNIIDKKEFNADILSNFENSYNFILSKLNTNYIIGRERVEKLELPEKAIREALINAFVHRDYFSEGHIQIDIFLDRLEISNPGGLVSGFDQRDFGKRSLPRNSLLMDMMLRVNKVEKVGSGIQRIKDSMKEYGLIVDFESTGFFTVTFQRKDVGKNAGKNAGKSERQKLILRSIGKGNFNQRIFAEELRVNKSTIERDLKELKDKIEFVGSKKRGFWRLTK